MTNSPAGTDRVLVNERRVALVIRTGVLWRVIESHSVRILPDHGEQRSGAKVSNQPVPRAR
jgi:hypothetical protein